MKDTKEEEVLLSLDKNWMMIALTPHAQIHTIYFRKCMVMFIYTYVQ